jgi:propanol-preferring alcohol dehydrogenase
MKAFRYDIESGQPPRLLDVPVPTPAPGQVLVKVAGCGLSGSDLRMIKSNACRHAMQRPFTLGHEAAGWIAELGSGVKNLTIGEPVAVYPHWSSCATCRACRAGREHECAGNADIESCGFGRDGGLAEYLLVPDERFLVRLHGLEAEVAGPLVDTGLAAYGAVKPCLSMLPPDSTAVVLGVGNLGTLAIQLLRQLTGARVIAVDANEGRLELARQSGADLGLIYGSDTELQLREQTCGIGANVVIDCVGVDATMLVGVRALARGGRYVLTASDRGGFRFTADSVPPGAQICVSGGGGTVDLSDLIALAAARRVRTFVDRYPLSRVDQACKDLEAGLLRGRAVCVPDAVMASSHW